MQAAQRLLRVRPVPVSNAFAPEAVEVTVNCAILRRLLEEHAILCWFALGRRSVGGVVAGWWQ
ncbi:hypothetical protein OKW43_006850 [Paraburkholderia sp. WC7.3g]